MSIYTQVKRGGYFCASNCLVATNKVPGGTWASRLFLSVDRCARMSTTLDSSSDDASAKRMAMMPVKVVGETPGGETTLKVAWPKWRIWLAVFGTILGVVSFGFAITMAFRNDVLRRENTSQQEGFLKTTNELVATLKTQSEQIGRVVDDIEQKQDGLIDSLVKHAQSAGAVENALITVHNRIDRQAHDTQQALSGMQTLLARTQNSYPMYRARATSAMDRATR